MRKKRKRRKLNPRVMLVCEGLTEQNYFQAIKEDPEYKHALLAIVPHVIRARFPTPDKVVKEAISRAAAAEADGNPFEEIWVIFDHDHFPGLQKAYEKASRHHFNIAFSAICFEVWLLLHFKKTTYEFASSKEVIKALKAFYPNYKKAAQNDFANLKPHLDTGMQHAAWLRKQKAGLFQHITGNKTWTDVDLLVRRLIHP